MINIVILGSTGSLGIQTLEVLNKYQKHFRIVSLSANTQEKLLNKQAKKFKVKNIILTSRDGEKAIKSLTALKEADIIINVLSGISGIGPSLAALKSGKILILGNKESLFVKGKEIMKLALPLRAIMQTSVQGRTPFLIPLDSEHNAIFEIIQKIQKEAKEKNLPPPKIKKIILPCSGGPFYGKTKAQLKNVTAIQALRHPKYKMGKKISIESATLLNKGLEIIEAHHLFNLPLSKIETRLHFECKIHGAIEFEFSKNSTFRQNPIQSNSKTYAYFSKPDMREHIENALFRAANQLNQPLKFNIKPPITDFPNRNIKLLTAHSAKTLKSLIPGPLTGIKIILGAYKKSKNNPAKLKNFLLHEQKTVQKFLDDKIKFTEIFNKLKI